MEQHQGFFQELKQIYNIKIPIPEPSVYQQKHAKKFLFYIDLTNTQKYYDLMSKLSINNSQERQWQGGQLCEFEFQNDKQEQQSIFCYYFDNFIENDEIKIQSLFRFRIFLDNFIKTQENYQIKFVFHFVLKKNQNYLEFEQHLIKYSYLILDGSFYKDQDFICVYDKWDKDEMNCCKVSSKKIHHNKNKVQDRFDLSYIKLLDEAFVYAQYKQIVQNSIGYKCQEYLQSQVDVVLKEFEKELEKLQNDIELMIEFPVNLANEIESNQNVSQYLESLKTFIDEVFMLVKVDENFDKMVEGLLKALKNQRSKMLECLNKIVKEISQFENYLIINYQEKSPNEVFNQLLQFQFKLDESDIKVLQQIKQYQYNYGVITKTMLTIQINFYQWFEYFDLFLPQSFAYFQRINNKKYNINFKKPYVIVLGMTKVGKSTLLNILNKPENIRITKDNKFDVEKRNSKILLSHKNTSQTFQTQEVDIGEFIFVDTPGLRDTNGVNIVFNKLNIFNTINQVREQIFLFLIDGAQLSTSKNDLIDSINQINLMLTDQYLENNIIPI
ncbi:unnamed protein product [Paramecium octaurelia]|uniref:G domain-containing protein n=1 Tax=Paramecium octaurelia TaxID=43137 RepID=A0A8S1XPE8_PAROT|nr:unnamed protein product [Paramecium octaurelia]